MEPLLLPTDLPTWTEVRTCLVNLYDQLINKTIKLQEVGWFLQSLHTIAQSQLYNPPIDRNREQLIGVRDDDREQLLGFREDVGSDKILEPSSVWYDVLLYFQRMDQVEQDHFLYFTLPGIIQLAIALENCPEEEKQEWCRQQQESKVVLSRKFVCSVTACLFLQLFPRDSGFTSLFKRLSICGDAGELQGVLDYFDWVIKCGGMTIGGWVTLLKKTLSVPFRMDLNDFGHCDLGLCPLTLLPAEQTEGTEDGMIHVNFCSKSMENQGFEKSGIEENPLLRIYPELLAVEMKAVRMELNEALVVSGFETTCGAAQIEDRQKEHVTSKGSPVTFVMVEPIVCHNESAHQYFQDSLILQALNLELLGFTGSVLSDIGSSSVTGGKLDRVQGDRMNETDSGDNTRLMKMSSNSEFNVLFPSTKHSFPQEAFGSGDEVKSNSGLTQKQERISTTWQQQQQQFQQQQHLHQQSQVFKSIPSYPRQQQQPFCQPSQSFVSPSPSSPQSSSAVSSTHPHHPHQHRDHHPHQHRDQSHSHSLTASHPHADEGILSSSSRSPSSQSCHNTLLGASATQAIPISTSTSQPHQPTLALDGSNRLTSSQARDMHGHAHDSKYRMFLAKDRDDAERTKPENASSALSHSILSPKTPRNVATDEFLSDILGNFPKSKPGAFSAANTAYYSLPVSSKDDDDITLVTSVSTSQTPLLYKPIRFSPPVCDRLGVNVDVTLPLPTPTKTDSGLPSASCDVAKDTPPSNLSTMLGADCQRTSFNSPDNYSSMMASAPSQESSLPSSSTTLPPLQVEIPSLSPSSHGKNLSARASRRFSKRRAKSQEQPPSTHLEPPLSSSPHSSTSSVNTSPNSSFVLPDPGIRRSLNTTGDVEVTADFFIPGVDNPDNLNAFIEQEYRCLVPPPGTNGSRDLHHELNDLISSSSSTSGSGVNLGQCVLSTSGCSHWGSRSGSISSHGTNGSSNDFVEFWYNLRRRSSQLSDASRRSSSSKHSSDFSTDLEDISEQFSKHSHEIIEEEGVVNLLSDFASQRVSTAVQMGTETLAKRQDTETMDNRNKDVQCDDSVGNEELESRLDKQLRSGQSSSQTRGSVSGASEVTISGAEETLKVSRNVVKDEQTRRNRNTTKAESYIKEAQNVVIAESFDQRDEQGFAMKEKQQAQHENIPNKSMEEMKDCPGASMFSSPVDSAFYSGISTSVSPFSSLPYNTTKEFRLSSAKEIPPSDVNFSPPLPVQTIELGGNHSTSFAVLESKTVYLDERKIQRPPYSTTTAGFSSHSQSVIDRKAKFNPEKGIESQQKTLPSKKSRPSHIPRSSPPKSSSLPMKEPSRSLHDKSYRIPVTTTTSVLKSKAKHSSSSPSSASIKKAENTSLQYPHTASKSSNIPRLKASPRSPSDVKTLSHASKLVPRMTRTVSSPSFSKQQKEKQQKSPVHSPRSRYVFSDVAAPPEKVKDKQNKPKHTRSSTTLIRTKKGKVGFGVRKSPEHKRTSREEVQKPVAKDITRLPNFIRFVNSLAEQTVSQAVLEGAEMVSTPGPREEGEEELSDEVYNWFADKIVHQVFVRVLESLESRDDHHSRNEDGSTLNQDRTAIYSHSPTDMRSRFTLDDATRSWAPQHDLFAPSSILLRNGKPSSFVHSFKPAIQRQKSISSSSNGRGSALNKTVSFEDSTHEPIRTGSEGDLSKQSSFHHSFGSSLFHHDRQGSTWSVSSQEEGSTTDFLSSSHRVPHRESSMAARIHRRLSKSTTDLPRWGSLTSIGGSPTSSHKNLRAFDLTRRGTAGSSELINRRGLMRSSELLTRRGSLTNTDSASRGSLNTNDTNQRDSSLTNLDNPRGSSLTNSELCVDLYQAAVTIVDQVFRSISETMDFDMLKSEESTQDSVYTGVSYQSGQYAGFSTNIFSSSTQKASPKRSHRSVSPNVGVFSRKPMSRESLTNAFLKVDSQPSVQNYERRSSEPCHTSVQLSLEVFNKNRYNYKPAEEAQQTACTDDDIGRSSSRISWRRGSLDNFSFESRRNNMSGFKDPILSRFAEELMKADTSVPELVIVGSEPSSSTFGSRRSSMSGFRDTTLANLESELLNTSFTSVNSLPLSQSPRSQAGLGQYRTRSRSWERNHQARSDSSDTEHWFPLPRQLGDEFQLEFHRQHSQGQEEVRDFASFFAGCVVQEAVCVIKSEVDYQTEGEKAISLYAENLTDQILRDAFITTRGQDVQDPSSDFDLSHSDGSVRIKTVMGAARMDSRLEGKPYFGEGARPKLKTFSPSSSTTGTRHSTSTTHRRSGRHHNDSASSDGFGLEISGCTSSEGRGRKKSSGSGRPSETHPHHHYHPAASASESIMGVKPSPSKAIAIKSPPSAQTGSREVHKGRKFVSAPVSKGQSKTSVSVPLSCGGGGGSSGSGGGRESKATAKGTNKPYISGARTRHYRGAGGGVGRTTRGVDIVVKSGGGGVSSHSVASALSHKAMKTKTSRTGPLGDGVIADAERKVRTLAGKRQLAQHRDDSPDSLSSSSSSVCSDETGSSLLSHDSDTSYPPRTSLEERKKKKFTRQNAVSSRKTESKCLEGSWSRSKRKQRGIEISSEGLTESRTNGMVDTFSSDLSHQLVTEALKEVEYLPWWGWFPTCQKAVVTNAHCNCFSGDSQLQLVVQWMAASLSQCPQLVCILPGQIDMEEAERVVRHMSSWSVGFLASVIKEYRHNVLSTSSSSLSTEAINTNTNATSTRVTAAAATTTTMPFLQAADRGKVFDQEWHKDISSSSSVLSQPSFFQFLLDRDNQRTL